MQIMSNFLVSIFPEDLSSRFVMATVSYSPEDIENTLVPIPLTSEILEKAKLARKDQG